MEHVNRLVLRFEGPLLCHVDDEDTPWSVFKKIFFPVDEIVENTNIAADFSRQLVYTYAVGRARSQNIHGRRYNCE